MEREEGDGGGGGERRREERRGEERRGEREREIASSTKHELVFCRPVRTSLTHLPTWNITRPRVIVYALMYMREYI